MTAEEPHDWAYERVLRFLADSSGRSPDTIRDDEFLAAFDIDSLEDVAFVMELENELGIEIGGPPRLVWVSDLIEFVRSFAG